MNAIELLATRASNPKLTLPAPDPATLEAIVTAALRAPDHGLLRPTRLQVIEGDARLRFGDLLADAAAEAGAELDAAARDDAAKKALRAPMILVVSAHTVAHPKVPRIEQILTAGCVAHGVLLGLHARGFAGIWRTGPATESTRLKAGLGIPAEASIVGFVYVGTAAGEAPPIARPDASVLTAWPG